MMFIYCTANNYKYVGPRIEHSEYLFSKTNYFEATLEPMLLDRARGGNQTIYLSNGVVGL